MHLVIALLTGVIAVGTFFVSCASFSVVLDAVRDKESSKASRVVEGVVGGVFFLMAAATTALLIGATVWLVA